MNKKKVLVIDDERIVLDSVRRILSEENFEVVTTLNGYDGISLAGKDNYDLVLTDIRMPDISGKIVLREIKRNQPGLPVVIMSGFATVQSAIQCMRLGAAHVLEKPFTPADLTTVVHAAIEQSSDMPIAEQGLIHEEEIRRVLDQAAGNPQFADEMRSERTDTLDPFDLTAAEKLALVTGDVEWLEQYMGTLPVKHKKIFIH